MKLFVGIDMSKFSHCVCIMNEDGKKIKHVKVDNNIKGFQMIESFFQPGYEVLMGLEKGHGPIVEYFINKNVTLYSINPKIIKRYKDIDHVSGSKDDWRDSEAIASFLCKKYSELRPIFRDSKDVERIRDYCEVYNRLKETQAKLTNRLIYDLENYLPLYLDLFSGRTLPILWKMIIRYPTWDSIRSAELSGIQDFLRSNCYRNPKYVERVCKKIQEYQQVIRLETESALSFEAIYLAETLLKLSEKEDVLIAEMKKILDNHEYGQIFLSIPGAGTLISSHLLALFGDNNQRFNCYNDAQAYFGTAPYLYESGKYRKVMMRRACNKMGRRILYQLAFSSMNHCPWVREYYDDLRKRGKRNAAALRVVSNKWVKVIFSMWKNKMFYNPERLDKKIPQNISKIA